MRAGIGALCAIFAVVGCVGATTPEEQAALESCFAGKRIIYGTQENRVFDYFADHTFTVNDLGNISSGTWKFQGNTVIHDRPERRREDYVFRSGSSCYMTAPLGPMPIHVRGPTVKSDGG